MNKKNLTLLISLTAGGVLVATLGFGRSSSNRSLEATSQVRTTPLAELGSDQPRKFVTAPSGKHTDASKVQTKNESISFEKIQECYLTQVKAQSLRSRLRVCESSSTAKVDDSYLASCAADYQEVENDLADVEKDLKSCPSGNQTVRDYFENTRDLAKGGNSDAQICYIQSTFVDDGRGLDFTPADRQQYLDAVHGYITDAYSRGDWRVVNIRSTRIFTAVSGMLPLIVSGDAYTRFEMNRLLRQGAIGDYAKYLDDEAQSEYLSPGINSAPPLTILQIGDAQSKAQALYQEYFRNSPRLTESPGGCTTIKRSLNIQR